VEPIAHNIAQADLRSRIDDDPIARVFLASAEMLKISSEKVDEKLAFLMVD